MNISELGAEARSSIVSEMAKNKDFQLGWAEGVRLAEMIGTDAGAAKEFLEKVTYDIYAGRERVALIYPEIYNKTSDSNLPESLTVATAGKLEGAFLQHLEGGEVVFGALAPGQEKTVRILGWTLGFQFTKEFILFNQTWRVSEVAAAFGEAYNKLLNHLHLGPIVTGSFTTTGGGLLAQKTSQKAGTAQLVAYSTSIAQTLKNAMQVLPKGTKILCNSFDTEAIYNAIKSDFVPNTNGSVPTRLNRAFSADSFVEYDGAEAKLGGKTYTYAGVTQGTAYLLVPKSENFREYEKQDLQVNTGDADLSRLVLEQSVGDTWRGVFCALGGEEGVVKFNLS